MKNNQKGFVIALVIAIVVILVGVGTYVMYEKDAINDPRIPSNENSTSTQVANYDWKLYENNSNDGSKVYNITGPSSSQFTSFYQSFRLVQ